MYEKEEVLDGGNVNRVVKIADTVRRPTGPWSTSVHELLRQLDEQGFAGAPKFLGMDSLGREMLSFIPGQVAGNDYPSLPSFMWSDASLVKLARLLRQYHDATVGLSVSDGKSSWQGSYSGDGDNEVICHNDAALYNVVFHNSTPIAFIDFDMAAPGPRLWDIAYTLYTSVPLANFSPDSTSGTVEPYSANLHATRRRRRIQLFCDSYGIPVPDNLKDWVVNRLQALCDTLREGAARGNPAFQKMVDEGHLRHYEKEIAFVHSTFAEWGEGEK